MNIHANSRESFHGFDHDSREAQVLRVFVEMPQHGHTDRQIAAVLGFKDLNAVRPTITRLTDLGYLYELCHVQCPETNRRVRASAYDADRTKKRTPKIRSIPITPEIRKALESLMVRHTNHTPAQVVHWALVQALKGNTDANV